MFCNRDRKEGAYGMVFARFAGSVVIWTLVAILAFWLLVRFGN